MIIVKVVKNDGSKTIVEELNIDKNLGGCDEILLARDDMGIEGSISLKQRDINRIYWEKQAERIKQVKELQVKVEEKLTKEESEQQKELAELREWKAEMSRENFIQQVFTLWNMRKCQ